MIKAPNTSLYYHVITPEGVAISLPVAGLWSRSAAWLIDISIRIFIYIISAIILSLFGLLGQGLMLIIFFTLEWFYPVFYEVLSNGKTPGKRVIGIKVMQMNGSHPGWASSMTRNLIRFIDILPLAYGIGFISVISSRYFQRIGDIVANTIVIHEQLNLSSLPSYKVQNIRQTNHKLKQFVKDLNHEEKASITSYYERFQDLSSERRQELAEILSPVLSPLQLQANEESVLLLAKIIMNENEPV